MNNALRTHLMFNILTSMARNAAPYVLYASSCKLRPPFLHTPNFPDLNFLYSLASITITPLVKANIPLVYVNSMAFHLRRDIWKWLPVPTLILTMDNPWRIMLICFQACSDITQFIARCCWLYGCNVTQGKSRFANRGQGIILLLQS